MFKSAAILPTFVLAVSAACAAVPVSAKPLSQILAQSPLAPADFDAMRAAEAALYEHAGVKVGSSVKWSNPETSSRGVVKVTSKRGGCISLQHRTYPKGGSAQSELSRKFCKSASGTWLLSQ